MQWDSSCIIITFQPPALCRKVQKLHQLGVSMIGNIAPFAHSNGNILLLLLLLLFVIRPVLQLLPHTTANHQNSLRFVFVFFLNYFCSLWKQPAFHNTSTGLFSEETEIPY